MLSAIEKVFKEVRKAAYESNTWESVSDILEVLANDLILENLTSAGRMLENLHQAALEGCHSAEMQDQLSAWEHELNEAYK